MSIPFVLRPSENLAISLVCTYLFAAALGLAAVVA